MKNKFKIALALLTFVGFSSCDEESELLISEPVGSYRIVTPLNGESVVLNETTPTNPGISLTWTPMNYTTQSVITLYSTISAEWF